MKFEIVKYTDVWAGDYPGTWQVNNVMRLDGNFEIAGDPDDSEIIDYLINNNKIPEEWRGKINVDDGYSDTIELELNTEDYEEYPIMRLELID